MKALPATLKIIENGVALPYSEEQATEILSQPEVTAIADIKMGTLLLLRGAAI